MEKTIDSGLKEILGNGTWFDTFFREGVDFGKVEKNLINFNTIETHRRIRRIELIYKNKNCMEIMMLNLKIS